MQQKVVILGSTGSIGTSTLSILKHGKFKVELLTTNKNVNKIFKQAILHKVKNIIIEDKIKYLKYKKKFERNNINTYHGLNNIKKIIKKKVSYCINAISGIDGLEPTLDIIPKTKNILIANKESIICGWNLIEKKLIKSQTRFIPIDSEHFSIWSLLNKNDFKNIDKIVLTASGGPFLNKPINSLANIKPKIALKHPNWKMGKKISIDSSTMMNKIFEYIEAKKIFNLKKKNISILIHPTSYVHALIFFKNGIIKLAAHKPKMKIPISSAMNLNNYINKNQINKSLKSLNNLKFELPNIKKFPLMAIIPLIPEKQSYFETILITLNDNLVERYLNNQINYVSINKNLLKIIKNQYFIKYYKLKPKNICDIKNMIKLTKKYLDINIKYYDK